MIGSVAACAASETPRLSASQRGTRPRPARSIHPVSGVAQAMRPAVASDDSWKPASPMRLGSLTSSSVAAQPRAALARPARPVSRASRTTPAMSAARTTDGEPPANATYATIATIGHDRAAAAAQPSGERGDGRCDDRDVPAGDRHHVADAGGREGRCEVPIDRVAQADQDPCREPGLRLGQHASERLGRTAPQRLESSPRVIGDRLDADGPRLERPGGADPLEVRAVWRVGAWEDPAVDDDAIARDHDRIARQRCRDRERDRGVGRRPERRHLLSVAGRARRRHDERPRSVTRGRHVQRRRPGRHDGEAQHDQGGSGQDRHQRPGTEAWSRLGKEQHRREPERHRRREMVRRDLTGGDGGCDRADRESSRCDPCQRTVTRSLSCPNVFSPTSLRVRRSSTAVNGCSSRAAMILAAVTGPMPGSPSSCAAVAWLRSSGPVAAAVEGARRARASPGPRRRATGHGSGRRRAGVRRGSGRDRHARHRPADRSRRQRPRGRRPSLPAAGGRHRAGRPRRRSRRRVPCQPTLQVARPGSRATTDRSTAAARLRPRRRPRLSPTRMRARMPRSPGRPRGRRTAAPSAGSRPTSADSADGLPVASAPVAGGSSRTRHGVVLGSTHRPPRRDGRAATR